HREFFSHAKVERTHEPGRPIASYRLALYNHFRGTNPRMPGREVRTESDAKGSCQARQAPRLTSLRVSAIAAFATCPFPATRRIVGAMASRNEWIISSRFPIQSAIMTTGIMIVMNG